MLAELRIFFEKSDRMRFISHLDLNRAFTRALFASHLPVWFTEGFNRHPHLVFGQPLPLGMAGERETLDLRMNEEVDGSLVKEKLNEQLPMGIRVVSADPPQRAHKDIRFARYRIEMDKKYFDSFSRFWDAESILSDKKTKRSVISVDLKKEVQKLSIDVQGDHLVIHVIMPCSFECSIGPAVLLRAFEKAIGSPVFTYQIREGFLLQDFSNFT